MSEDERNLLHSSLLWEPDGHLSEVAQNAIVDAESALLPRDAREHAETCERCTRSIGALAQLSLEIDSSIKQLDVGFLPHCAAHIDSTRRAPRSLRHAPWAELGLALTIALLGQLPTLRAFNLAAIRQALQTLLRLSLQLLQHVAATPLGAALPWIAASMLVAISGTIAYASRTRLVHNLHVPSSTPPRG